MSDRLPTESSVPGRLSDADRDARIERLLLSGLDHYFAGEYERAINIWTRVAFLERGHRRARAYIDRARGALAERQRESEALVHAGVEAYRAGELQTARDLLTRATSEDRSSDTAMLFIERLERLDAASEAARVAPAAEPGAASAKRVVDPAASGSWLTTIVISVAVAAVIFVGVLRVGSWLAELPGDPPVPSPSPDPLPIVRAADLRLSQARELRSAGRLREALRLLDEIDVGDPARPDADRLMADMQRVLLGLPGSAP